MSKKNEMTAPADPEVRATARRRTFTAEYKLTILEAADRCTELGEVGELLRREGLYSSHLTEWRRARRDGALSSLSKKRGRKPKKQDREVDRLRSENARLRRELEQAQTIIEVQKKLSEILGIPLKSHELDENG